MKIFISYRRADSTYLVGRIKDRLIAMFGDQTVFRDLDDIPAGVDFRTILEEDITTEYFEQKTIYLAEGLFWMEGFNSSYNTSSSKGEIC